MLIPAAVETQAEPDPWCVQQSSMHKSFLFDINAKLYVAMDINSVESSTFQLCSDYLGRMMVFQSLFE
jgi:hypothetical protein